ncbi:hypothetical protein [Streptomyces boncukensis]|uniref:Uncharacterized protein n=1 Tax=Streptomyces boncukensis TaxID=2711219 RepID=A0A6G4X588_9ACTN|nr:hypothetical protein [Streptomyces boncukensis]NGO71831.1 hypothetical protein [Streptomyces boncukensis]
MHKAIRRPLARRHLRAAEHLDIGVLYATLSAGMLLARRHLTTRGCTQEFADRYGSAYGRVAAKTYRATYGAEPRRAWSNISGTWRRVIGYLPSERHILDTAMRTYPRTAAHGLAVAA